MASTPVNLLLLLSYFLQVILGLEVTPGSSCSTFCLDRGNGNGFDSKASTTNTSDISCKDPNFFEEDAGIKFKSCMECLQKSKKVNGSESDLHWYIYNMRYTISTCLFSAPAPPLDDDTDSPCVIDYACRALEKPLVADNLTSDGRDTYGYCSADGGSFSKDNVNSCISCLQASSRQVYLANFMTVLEAGCEQQTEPGGLLGITGAVFSKNAVNITAPTEDIRTKPKGAGSSTLTTGTIVGIAVGCGLLLFGAIALFIVHWRRQKKFEHGEKSGNFGSQAGTPDPFFPPESHKMSTSLRSYNKPRTHHRNGSWTAGDYYDKLEEEMGAGRVNYNFDPRASSRGPNSAIPTHQAYNPQALSRNPHETIVVENRNLSPPLPVHQRTRSNTPDSYVLQPYLPVAENHRATGTLPPPQLSVKPETHLPPPSLPGPPPRKPKIPSLVMPSVPKLKLPKKYTPPIVTVQDATPVDDDSRNLQISQPVMSESLRFNDRPLGGAVVYAAEAPPERQQLKQEVHGEIPMRSGKSTLYGY